MSKWLVFGSTGLLGASFLDGSYRSYQQYLGLASNGLSTQYIATPRMAFELPLPQLVNFLEQEKASGVVQAAATTNVDALESNPVKAYHLNGLSPAVIANACQVLSIPFVHFSTEAVFSGDSFKSYKEEDDISPLSVYAKSKAHGEIAVMASNPNSIIFRISWLYRKQEGHHFPSRLLKQLESTVSNIPVVTDVCANPAPVGFVSAVVDFAMRRPLQGGLYHLTPVGCISKYDWGLEVSKRYGYDPSRITPTLSRFYGSPAPRPTRVDLDSGKLRSYVPEAGVSWRDLWDVENSNPQLFE